MLKIIGQFYSFDLDKAFEPIKLFIGALSAPEEIALIKIDKYKF